MGPGLTALQLCLLVWLVMFSHIGVDVKSNGDYLSMIRGVFSADEGVCIETEGVIKGGGYWGGVQ